MANFLTPDIAKTLADLPESARDYLIDLISITLGEFPAVSDEDHPMAWVAHEWRQVRSALGGEPTDA